MSVSVWLSLLLATVIISFTPGAGAVNTMSNALSVGWRRSIWGIIGQQLALVVHIVIVAAGVGLIVAQSPVFFTTVRYLGAAYLAYLGVRLLVQKPTAAPEDESSVVQQRESRWSLVRRGFWVNLLNPKAIVFFLAFIPQFVRLDQDPLPQYVILTATVVIVDIVVMWGFFAVAARPFGKFVRTPRGQRGLNAIFGVLFLGVAALLLFLH